MRGPLFRSIEMSPFSKLFEIREPRYIMQLSDHDLTYRVFDVSSNTALYEYNGSYFDDDMVPIKNRILKYVFILNRDYEVYNEELWKFCIR